MPEELDVLIMQEQQVSATVKVSQLIDDGLTLFSTWFCSSDNCYCFLWITCKLKIKQSATDLSQWLLFSNLNYLNTLKTLKKGYYFHEVRDKIFKILKPGLHK